jgi:phosphate:Na+ symporter
MVAIAALFGGLGVFLYGMRIMSEGLEAVAGDRMRGLLARATDNRLMGVLTGFATTSFVQSSSATTVMMVSFVNAGLLTLSQTTGIIMGANIGTTVTGWLVSLLGFKVKISAFALPAVAIGFFVRFLKRDALTRWGEVLVGFGLLFLGLGFLKDALPNMNESPELATLLHRYSADGYLATALVICVGSLLTVVVQSSSAVMAVTLTAAANGLIDFETGCALVLGENIGTTATALLAGISTTRAALRAALIHTVFNLCGVFWVWLAFPAATQVADLLVAGDPASAAHIPNHLAMFHTLFNLTNTALMLPLAGLLVRFVKKVIPGESEKAEAQHTSDLLWDDSFVALPHLAIEQARHALRAMVVHIVRAVSASEAAVRGTRTGASDSAAEGASLAANVARRENEIHEVLLRVSRAPLTREIAAEVALIQRLTDEVTRVGHHINRVVESTGRLVKGAPPISDRARDELAALLGNQRALLMALSEGLAASRKDRRVKRATRSVNDLLRFREQVDALHEEFERTGGAVYDAHIERLSLGACRPEHSRPFLELLASMESTGDHAQRIAALLDAGELPANRGAEPPSAEPPSKVA